MRTLFVLGLLLVVTACLEQMPLPSLEESVRPDFNPDTTYLPLSPSWGSADGLVTPVEVVVSHARHVFVADTAAREIFVFDQAGTRLDQVDPTYATLDFDHLGADFTPTDMDFDGRLNLLIINGSNKIYRWNQFWNIHGIDSVVSEILVKNTRTGERLWLPPFQLETADYLQSPDWIAELDSSRYEKNDAAADSLLRPHEFFDMALWVNQQKDIFYRPERTVFSAISAARLDDYFFYAADSMQNRILRAALVRNGAIKLGNGKAYFTHFALFVDNVKEIGTGAGTVNRPTGLDVDNFGNLYYSQYGKHLYVHSVRPSKALRFPSRFELFVDDIMTPGQYLRPTDVAVDSRQMIYVANTDLQEILVFNGDGSFFKKAGIEKVRVDTTMWVPFAGEGSLLDTSLWVYFDSDSALVDTTIFIPAVMDSALVDTFYYREIKGQLIEPASVAADERGVIYVCDPAQGGVFRFILSTSFDEALTNINQ
ncbi:MAG: hypothetical protein ACETWG_13205 [Candidatus Neomarinimicrobiota bacterium]